MERRIPLGPVHTLGKEDLSRALFCAVAVYMNNAEAENYLRKKKSEYPSATFHKVHMSQDCPDRQKFLVAYTDQNDVFIAFKGTETLQDLACDLRIDEQSKFGGSFHKGFFERADILTGDNHNPLNHLLLESGFKRIIFCGHSLGGAVAHTTLLRFLLESNLLLSPSSMKKYPDNSMFSIAFGAPHVCDGKAAEIINSNMNLKWRFINVINQSDPIPRALHHLKSTALSALRTKLSEDDFTLKSIGGFLGPCLDGYVEGGIPRLLRNAAFITGRRYITSEIVTRLQNVGSMFENAIPDSNEPDFYPIGLYIFLSRNSPAGGNDWGVDEVDGDSLDMTSFLSHVDFAQKNLEYHQLVFYLEALVAVSFLDIPITGGCNSPLPHEAPSLLVSTPAPKAKFAEWRNLDSDQQYIIIKGENLLFLRDAVKINGLEPWTTIEQSDNMLVICDPRKSGVRSSLQRQDSSNRLENAAVSLVVIKTAFGDTHCVIVEDSRNQERDTGRISKMLSKIIQTLVVKSTPPLSVCPSDDVLGRLERIMTCAPGLRGNELSTNLRNITKCSGNNGDIAKHIKEINDMVKTVMKFLRSSLKLDTQLTEEQADQKFTLLLAVALVVAVGAAGIPTLALSLAAVGSIAVGTTIGGVMIFRNSGVIMEEYLDVLKLAIEETSEWSELDQLEIESSEEAFEDELIRQVQGASPRFKDMIESLNTKRLRSETFQEATPDSKLRLLTRIKVVVDTLSLWNTEVDGKHFMGIFGAEDSGKSTFIKRVLEHTRYGPRDSQLPQTGMLTHTTVVRPYRVGSSMWLVDFPGKNGIGAYADMWKQFTALSNSAVLLLNFEFDIKRDQVEMYLEMKASLQTELVVVFNKVDIKFTPRDSAIFTAEYFEEHRKRSAEVFGCSEDDVYFASLDPDPAKKLAYLKRMGVLGYEEVVEKLVARQILFLN